MPWSSSRISFRNDAYSRRDCGPIRGVTRTLSTYISTPAATVPPSTTVTRKNAVDVGACALTMCTVVTSPAAIATDAPDVVDRYVPAAFHQSMLIPTEASAAGA